MNKAWFFGCSFTAGTGYNFEEYGITNDDSELWNTSLYFKKFSLWKTKHQYEIWPYLLSNELGLECINKGSGGSTNDKILHSVINNLRNIESGDYVIIGLTIPSRILIPNPDIASTGQKMVSSIIDSFSFSTDHSSKILQTFGKHKTLPKEKKEAVINYLFHIIYPQRKLLREYFLEIFVNLSEYLVSTGKTVILWDYNKWYNYETISNWSNNAVQDGHWSINGHREFADLMKSKILENKETKFINLVSKNSPI